LTRVAIVHDWFQGYHGSERVVEAMRARVFAGSPPDVFTFHAARELLPPALAAAIVGESRLARLPGIRQRGYDRGRWRYLLPLMPRYFNSLPLGSYDLVVSSSHAFAVGVRPRPDALHVCYCYTPLRYAWFAETDARVAPGFLRRRLRRLDLAASARPDVYVAISEAVRERIRQAYGRDAVVVHPPVELADLRPDAEQEPNRFLWVGRLVEYKRPLLVAEAFRDLPYHLTMVGVGPLERRLRRTLPANVTLLPWLERAELVELFARASGFVHVGEEDFGIALVEALGSGTPVLALARGGALDIVRPEIDGLLLERANVDAVRAGVRQLASRDWDRGELAARARLFETERFVERFRACIDAARGAP
jgi:glycosyltransferase involved in cell wall biosynthesis